MRLSYCGALSFDIRFKGRAFKTKEKIALADFSTLDKKLLVEEGGHTGRKIDSAYGLDPAIDLCRFSNRF
ncbi:hypothetical protein QU42_03420 [Bradyrhizobium sp. UASWS1016]|nr:hypothetical protein QU41_00945 [Bradyrhizobium elkanii]OCX32586.1 hypothetical protein QU42_03420 [Bradyrhizobium sp. UASWS1016]